MTIAISISTQPSERIDACRHVSHEQSLTDDDEDAAVHMSEDILKNQREDDIGRVDERHNGRSLPFDGFLIGNEDEHRAERKSDGHE